jgi:hypothetical protein
VDEYHRRQGPRQRGVKTSQQTEAMANNRWRHWKRHHSLPAARTDCLSVLSFPSHRPRNPGTFGDFERSEASEPSRHSILIRPNSRNSRPAMPPPTFRAAPASAEAARSLLSRRLSLRSAIFAAAQLGGANKGKNLPPQFRRSRKVRGTGAWSALRQVSLAPIHIGLTSASLGSEAMSSCDA